MAARASTLFDAEHLEPVPPPPPPPPALDGPTLRAVYFPDSDERDAVADVVHLVRCAGGEKNLRSIALRDLPTIRFTGAELRSNVAAVYEQVLQRLRSRA